MSRRVTRDPSEPLRVVGYARVSTADQGADGHGMGAQRAAIENECNRRGWTLLRIAEDVLSGKSKGGRGERLTNRPGLAGALEDLDVGNADVLMLSRLDRLSRSLPVSGEVLERAEEKGWAVQALDLGLDMTTPAGELMAGVMIVTARYERRIIRERIVAALAHAKEHGTKSGKPIGRASGLGPETIATIRGHRDSGMTMREIADALNDAGVPTSQGGALWHPGTISLVLRNQDRQDQEAAR